MIDSLLIANRGEIARRIIRTAKRLGIRTVAIHSTADADLPFVREASEAVEIGGPAARDSYLSIERILDAARRTAVAAIHPGYGFLSENADFADAISEAGLIWVGAPPAAIRAMGMKDAAKSLMLAAGVPVTPGYSGEDQSLARMSHEARITGYPVLIKAVAGGGGKGMRKVEVASDFADALLSCRREALAAFGDERVLLEKYIPNPRHIEVQVFGDTHGNFVHLFERDCSLQRRHQKVIEEAPAPGMDETTRAAICEAALKAAKAVNYVGAGTIEFIADASEGLWADRIWFMEMNTRLQVEHPVTEAITGEDLVEWQLRVASGEPLPKKQQELSINGWAVEGRLYAENPAAGFLPSIGPLRHLKLPDVIRVDSGVEQGNDITPHYDPMIAKLIAHAPNRRQAIRQLASACRKVEIWPVRTNAAFLARALSNDDFADGAIDTGFIERHAEDLMPGEVPEQDVIDAAAHALLPSEKTDPWSALAGFRIAAPPDLRIKVEIGHDTHWGTADPSASPRAVEISDEQVLFHDGEAWPIGYPSASSTALAGSASDGTILSPMPGTVISVDVSENERVTKGRKLLTIEAMKMEHSLLAPFDGVVSKLTVAIGARVSESFVLAVIEKEAP